MSVLLESKPEERAHQGLEVEGLGEHAGLRGLGGAVTQVENGHDTHERSAEGECDRLVLVDVDAHVLCDELVGANGVGVRADLGVVQDEPAEEEREKGDDEVPGIGPEELVGVVETRAVDVGNPNREALVDEGESGRDDDRRNVHLDVGNAVGEAENDAHDNGNHDDGEPAERRDEVHATAADGVDEGGLQVGHELVGGTERCGGPDLEDRPDCKGN